MKIVYQISIILIFTLIGELISYILPFSFPGNIIGMTLFFIALMLKIVKVSDVEESSNWLQKNMSLFFIPLIVGIVEYVDIIKTSLISILIILVITTIVSVVTSAYISKWMVENE